MAIKIILAIWWGSLFYSLLSLQYKYLCIVHSTLTLFCPLFIHSSLYTNLIHSLFSMCTLSSLLFFKLSARNSMCWSNTESYVIYFEHTYVLRDLLFIFVSRMFLHIILICSHCLFHSLYHQIFLYLVAEYIVTCFN